MIRLKRIEIRGRAAAGEFSGSLGFGTGLQVISAQNAYGKSLAVKSVAWCLGLEPMFGNVDNDPIILPEAVRESVTLEGYPDSPVISSECAIWIEDDAGRQLEIRRDIKGGDRTVVQVRETGKDGRTRSTKLMARKSTMLDESGGFQRFSFDWLGWPLIDVPTYRLGGAKVYLENLTPLFYIDQNEGWTEIQALQISRYGQQEISEIAVEYLLGAMAALQTRVNRVLIERRVFELKDSARAITERVMEETLRRGWRLEWSSHGSIDEVIKRWSARNLRAALRADANVDFDVRRKDLNDRIERLRKALTSDPIDEKVSSAPVEVSQRAIDLKRKRHTVNEDLSTLNVQLRETSALLASLEHRIHAASDLLRLKNTGVGRLEHLECPTCHRDLDPEMFGLSAQSAESVDAHIEALKSDRELMLKNRESISANIKTAMAVGAQIEMELRDAERALTTVSSAVGPLRERLAATAAELTAAERESERLSDAAAEIDSLQESIDRWIADAGGLSSATAAASDAEEKRTAFTEAFRKYLVALGHSEVHAQNSHLVVLDKDNYVPFMNGRRLRALGSASDQSRLVAAYSLALAAASQKSEGKHPGLLILDEPLQQNPDPEHRERFQEFLEKEIAQQSKFQTLIFTSLYPQEIDRLRKKGTEVTTPAGPKFLTLVKPPQQVPPLTWASFSQEQGEDKAEETKQKNESPTGPAK